MCRVILDQLEDDEAGGVNYYIDGRDDGRGGGVVCGDDEESQGEGDAETEAAPAEGSPGDHPPRAPRASPPVPIHPREHQHVPARRPTGRICAELAQPDPLPIQP